MLITNPLFQKESESVAQVTPSLSSTERHIMTSCASVSVEMSHSVVWGNLWSQDCNISAEWRKSVFHLVPTKLLNSGRLYEPHHS